MPIFTNHSFTGSQSIMNPIALKIFLQMFFFGLPTMIVCLGACVVILIKRKSGSSWQLWALSGFGFGLIIAIVAPITQAVIQSWMLQSGNTASYTWIFSLLGGFWSVSRAIAYALIFVAVLEGRE